jgi:hypothetical protein
MRSVPRPPKMRFRRLVDRAIPSSPRLPLVHTTDSYLLQDILSDEVVTPQPCEVFAGEHLTYLFYARPAFRPNLGAEPLSLLHYFPVCLIFKPDWIAKTNRIFPFDSGAFHRGFYDAYIHKHMDLLDFALEADANSPGKVVASFFGSNASYVMGRSTNAGGIDPAEFEAHSYLALAQARESNAVDNRSATIEIQTDDVLHIRDAVAAIVLPSTFLDGDTGLALKKFAIDPLPYRTFERSRPGEYTSTIFQICVAYYVKSGLVDEKDL